MTDTTVTEYTTTALEDPTALTGIDWAEAGAMYPDWRGINYDRNMTVKDIAAVVRKELRKAIKAGKLGTAVKVNVRYETYAGGCSINTTITVPKVKVNADTPGATKTLDRYGDEVWVVIPDEATYATPGHIDTIEPGAREAQAKAEAFIATFNYNGSNTQIDYFNVRFYGSVDLRNENGGWE